MELIITPRRYKDFKNGSVHGKSAQTRLLLNCFLIMKGKTSPLVKGKSSFDF